MVTSKAELSRPLTDIGVDGGCERQLGKPLRMPDCTEGLNAARQPLTPLNSAPVFWCFWGQHTWKLWRYFFAIEFFRFRSRKSLREHGRQSIDSSWRYINTWLYVPYILKYTFYYLNLVISSVLLIY